MKITHKLKEHMIEKEVNDSTPLSFFSSNKIGGMFFFDVNKDRMQYFASIAGKPFKIIHDIDVDSGVKEVHNQFHSLRVKRESHEHEFFAPFFMNALVIKSGKDSPYTIHFEPKHLASDSRLTHTHYVKEGRVLLKSESDDHSVYIVLQGDNLKYDCKKSGDRHSLGILADKLVIAAADNEEDAILTANHISRNESKLKGLQESYVVPALKLNDPHKALAYACVLNGTDHMFLQSEDRKTMVPIPHFSDVTHPHPSFAAHALLMEGEFGTVKNTILRELDMPSAERFHESAWPVLMLGRLLDRLCSEKKLYNYFSTEEIKSIASKVAYLTNLTEQEHFTDEKSKTHTLEVKSMMLLMHNLAYALTKMHRYSKAEGKLKEDAAKLLFDVKQRLHEKMSREDAKSIFLSSYVYPKLVSEEEWRSCFDLTLERMHGDFRTLHSKENQKGEEELELELFGLMSLAATVLSRFGKDQYSRPIADIVDSAVKEVLFKGVIGRPSSGFSMDADPERGLLVKNTHMANNALFLEMIRECS
ncbi:TPA: hypothetical protein HA265_01895 [Candidatus Woesearchaeota archaeon]|nr:hypothetical protein [Candidatus Woesearchaeota archaeon]